MRENAHAIDSNGPLDGVYFSLFAANFALQNLYSSRGSFFEFLTHCSAASSMSWPIRSGRSGEAAPCPPGSPWCPDDAGVISFSRQRRCLQFFISYCRSSSLRPRSRFSLRGKGRYRHPEDRCLAMISNASCTSASSARNARKTGQ